MELSLTPDELLFRSEVRDFLCQHLTPELREAGRRATSAFMPKNVSIAWQKVLNARGWAAPGWPKEHGRHGLVADATLHIRRGVRARRRAQSGSHGAENGRPSDHGFRDG